MSKKIAGVKAVGKIRKDREFDGRSPRTDGRVRFQSEQEYNKKKQLRKQRRKK